MAFINGIFGIHALGRAVAADSASEAAGSSNSDAETGGLLTLEYRDDPFRSLMRKVEKLIDLDPAEALRLADCARKSGLFTAPRMEERLKNALNRIVEVLHEERALGAAFMRGVLDTTAPVPVISQPSLPAFATAAPRSL